MGISYSDISLPRSSFGERLFEAGRDLVLRRGVRLEEIVWDADEVLWDWVMDFGRMLRSLPGQVLALDLFGHREFFRIKPGVWELLFGMRSASLELGLDATMRIWTNGYAWRLWRIGVELPILPQMLGFAEPALATPQGYAAHPQVFYRGDFVSLALDLRSPKLRSRVLEALPAAAAEVLSDQLIFRPRDSTLKLPELAVMAGKSGFGASRVLVDDEARNVHRFVASGRRGIHLLMPRFAMLGGKLLNTVWRDPWGQLAALSSTVALRLAFALSRAAEPRGPLRQQVTSREPVAGYRHVEFTFRIPGEAVATEWIQPRRKLHKAASAHRQ